MIDGSVGIVASIGVAILSGLWFALGYAIGKGQGLVEEFRDEEKAEDA